MSLNTNSTCVMHFNPHRCAHAHTAVCLHTRKHAWIHIWLNELCVWCVRCARVFLQSWLVICNAHCAQRAKYNVFNERWYTIGHEYTHTSTLDIFMYNTYKCTYNNKMCLFVIMIKLRLVSQTYTTDHKMSENTFATNITIYSFFSFFPFFIYLQMTWFVWILCNFYLLECTSLLKCVYIYTLFLYFVIFFLEEKKKKNYVRRRKNYWNLKWILYVMLLLFFSYLVWQNLPKIG